MWKNWLINRVGSLVIVAGPRQARFFHDNTSITYNNKIQHGTNTRHKMADYAAPVWAKSPHAQKLNTELINSVTNVEDLYMLARISPPDIRRDECARMEKTKQETNEAHSIYGQHPTERRLLHSVKPAEFSPKIIRCNEWLRRLQTTPHKVTVNLSESLARGYNSPWTTWRCLNRLRT